MQEEPLERGPEHSAAAWSPPFETDTRAQEGATEDENAKK